MHDRMRDKYSKQQGGTFRVVAKKGGETIYVDNPSKLPDASVIDEMREPIVEAHILTPQEYVGNVIKLCIEKRGVKQHAVCG